MLHSTAVRFNPHPPLGAGAKLRLLNRAF